MIKFTREKLQTKINEFLGQLKTDSRNIGCRSTLRRLSTKHLKDICVILDVYFCRSKERKIRNTKNSGDEKNEMTDLDGHSPTYFN